MRIGPKASERSQKTKRWATNTRIEPRAQSNKGKLEIPSYFIERFSPEIVLPQHYGGREELMAELVDRTKEDFPLTRFESPKARGERWHFKVK
jgi:hypothetical protein